MSYFTLKDETPAAAKLDRKRYDILLLRKDDILIQDISRPQSKNDKCRKGTKDMKATSI